MQQHPIPQNITTYKFRLVGNWTLKQFALLMIGVGLAVAVYFSNLYGPVKWLLIFTSFAFGASLAFLPIQERPLDQWIIAYIKAIYSPTQFIWRKKPEKPIFFDYQAKPDQLPEQTQEMINAAIMRKKAGLSSFIQTLPEHQIQLQLNRQERGRLDFIDSLYAQGANNQPPPLPKIHIATPPTPTLKIITPATEPIGVVYQAGIAPKPTPTPPPPTTPQKTVQAPLAAPISIATHPLSKPQSRTISTTTTDQPQATTTVVASGLQANLTATTDASLPFPSTPSTPNTLVGMVLDAKNNLVANAIVEVRDAEGIPVRATKTNKLGQFFSTTPLKNGTYDVVIEKDNYSFDILSLKLDGQVINPLKITATNQG